MKKSKPRRRWPKKADWWPFRPAPAWPIPEVRKRILRPRPSPPGRPCQPWTAPPSRRTRPLPGSGYSPPQAARRVRMRKTSGSRGCLRIQIGMSQVIRMPWVNNPNARSLVYKGMVYEVFFAQYWISRKKLGFRVLDLGDLRVLENMSVLRPKQTHSIFLYIWGKWTLK